MILDAYTPVQVMAVSLGPSQVEVNFWGYELGDPDSRSITPTYFTDNAQSQHTIQYIRANETNAVLQFKFVDGLQHNGWANMAVSFAGFGTVVCPWEAGNARYRTLTNGGGLAAFLRDTVTDTGFVDVTIAEG